MFKPTLSYAKLSLLVQIPTKNKLLLGVRFLYTRNILGRVKFPEFNRVLIWSNNRDNQTPPISILEESETHSSLSLVPVLNQVHACKRKHIIYEETRVWCLRNFQIIIFLFFVLTLMPKELCLEKKNLSTSQQRKDHRHLLTAHQHWLWRHCRNQ